MAQLVKNLPAMQETQIQSLGQEDALEEGMVTRSSNLAWRVLWTEKHGRHVRGVTESDTTDLHFHFRIWSLSSDKSKAS